MTVRNLFKITVIYFTETLFRAHMYAKRAQGKHVGASSMCPLHYCPPFFQFEGEKGILGLLATLFIKSTHPHLMSKEPAGREEERRVLKGRNQTPKPKPKNRTPPFPRRGVHPQRSAAMAMAYKMVRPGVSVSGAAASAVCMSEQPWLTAFSALCWRAWVGCRRRRG